ncbi:MAG: ATP-dependent DNA ligase, partial [Thermoprotei archaeon]
MLFKQFAEQLDRLEALSGRNEITGLLSATVGSMDKSEIAAGCYLILGKLRPDFEGVELGLGEKLLIRALAEATGVSNKAVSEMYHSRGDLGLVAYELKSKQKSALLDSYTMSKGLTVLDVHSKLVKIAKTSGEGAQTAKIKGVIELLTLCSPVEAKYVLKFSTGDLRLGFAEQTLLAALAAAFADGDKEAVERAFNLTSDVGYVAELLAEGGVKAVANVRVTPGRPLKPMLAERASSLEEILERMGGKAAFEYKYDGERVQAHSVKGDIVLFSRRGEKISDHYPDVVRNLKEALRSETFIVEGEIIAVEPSTGEMLPFQQLMHRRRKYDVEKAAEKFPTKTMLFDIAYADGTDYIPQPYLKRRKALSELLKPSEFVETTVSEIISDKERALKFFEQAVESGCEGVMAKTLEDIGYKAGKRGWAWIKYKRDYRADLTDTLDLVVVGGFYGRGKRAGKIGGYLLAAFNESDGTFETVCKV